MKCPNCSNEQTGGSFCTHCGERLVEQEKDQTVKQETRQEATSQVPPQMNFQKGDSKEPINKKHFKKSNLKKRKFTATEFKIAIYFSISSLAMIAMIAWVRSEEHTSELQSRGHLVCRLLLEKKKTT